jgi:hypothetical protein
MTILYEETLAADIAQLIVKEPMTNKELAYLTSSDRNTVSAIIYKMRTRMGIEIKSLKDGRYRLERKHMPAIQKPYYLLAYIMLVEASDWLRFDEIINSLGSNHTERSLRECICKNMGVNVLTKRGPNKEKLWRVEK